MKRVHYICTEVVRVISNSFIFMASFSVLFVGVNFEGITQFIPAFYLWYYPSVIFGGGVILATGCYYVFALSEDFGILLRKQIRVVGYFLFIALLLITQNFLMGIVCILIFLVIYVGTEETFSLNKLQVKNPKTLFLEISSVFFSVIRVRSKNEIK